MFVNNRIRYNLDSLYVKITVFIFIFIIQTLETIGTMESRQEPKTNCLRW
jgi:hypothetical protein